MKFINEKVTDKTSITTVLAVILIVALGLCIRLYFLAKTDFVLNDGGMFYTMILDLQQNKYILPRFTSYNLGQIPYAYPPVSFYIGAFLNQFLHIDMVALLRWYPFVFNILSIPAFFLVARELTKDRRQSLLATAFYAVLIPGYEWLISGGGLTRSPAHTLFIIALYFYLVFLRTRQKKVLAFSIITAGLMVLHHLEYGWVLAFSLVIFSFRRLKIVDCIRYGLTYLAGFALITSPYWVTIIVYHGPAPFLSALTTGDFSLVTSIGRTILMVFTHETLVNFINVLAIIGMLFSVLSRNYETAVWLLLIIFLDPRSAERILVFPVALLAGFCVDRVLLPGLYTLISSNPDLKDPDKRIRLATTIFLCFCVLYPFLLGFLTSTDDYPALTGLTDGERQAMAWVRDNTPADSQFVVLSPSKSWSVDRVAEWFPALSERRSLTTIQGTEWLPDPVYKNTIQDFSELQACRDKTTSCLFGWLEMNADRYSYIFASGDDFNRIFKDLDKVNPGEYTPVYSNTEISVYKKNG